MFDPFDAFDPIDPVPAPEPTREPFESVEESEATVDASDASEDQPTDAQPTETQPTEPRVWPARRWTTTARRPVQPNTSSPRPTPRRPAPPTSLERSDPDPVSGSSVDELAAPHDPTPPVPVADVTSFRGAALGELRPAVERLRAHGHVATVTDGLDADEPTIAVRFRPDPGPLAASSDGAPEPARFELRMAPDLDGGAQVVAGYARGSVGAPFTLLGRTRSDQMDGSWVARRFLEFIQRVLELT